MTDTGLSQADIDAMLSSAPAPLPAPPDEATASAPAAALVEPARSIAVAAEPKPASVAIMPVADAAPAQVDAAAPAPEAAADPKALRSLTARVERLETCIPAIDQLRRESKQTRTRAVAATAAVGGLDQRVASIEGRLRLRRAAGRSQQRSLWSVDVYLDLPAA